MVEFKFDAEDEESWNTALVRAGLIWNGGLVAVDDFDSACEWAAFDREAYDHLWTWAVGQETLADAVKVQLFDVLVRKPPHKSKGRTAFVERKLRYIAKVLKREFKFKQSATADVLDKLPGTPSRDRIRNIITGARKNN